MLAFLHVLLSVANAAEAVAHQALEEMRQVAQQVQQRWDEREREQEEAAAAAAAVGGNRFGAASQEEICRYFQRRLEQQDREGHPLEAMERGVAPCGNAMAVATSTLT